MRKIIRNAIRCNHCGDVIESTYRHEYNHNLFMSAENIQGNLLEEYIASKVHPYGFLWCDGNIVRAVDFCNTDGSCKDDCHNILFVI